LVKLAPAGQAAALYGAAFAAMKLRDAAVAQAYWARLSLLTRTDAMAARLTRLLGAELALAQGQPARALALLQDASDSGRAALFLRSQAGVQGGQPAQARQSLQTWLADHPRDAQAWQLLASAYTAEGRALGAIRAEAEVNVAQLDFGAGLARLKVAQDLARKGVATGDHIEASIVDTRTRQVELLVREQAVER
jgi:predicted Zn-dependent protease